MRCGARRRSDLCCRQGRGHLERARALNPNDPEVLTNVAMWDFYLGESAEGLRLVERAMELNPRHGDWYRGVKALCLFGLKRYDEAIDSEKLLQASTALQDFVGDVIILYADTPFIRAETLHGMTESRANGASIVVLGFESENPTGYGRLLTESDGGIRAIVEEKDATDQQRKITEVNLSYYVFNCRDLLPTLDQLRSDNTLIVIDACYSGTVSRGPGDVQAKFIDDRDVTDN